MITPKPFIIVVTGCPGSGKTTLSHQLADALHLPVLSRDEFKEGYVHTMGGSHDSLGKDVNGHLNDIFFETVAFASSKKISLVIEAAFQYSVWKPRLRSLANAATISLVVCSIDPHLARERCRKRALADSARERFHGDKPALAAKEGSEAPIGQYAPLDSDIPTILVDTTNGYHPSIEEVITIVTHPRNRGI